MRTMNTIASVVPKNGDMIIHLNQDCSTSCQCREDEIDLMLWASLLRSFSMSQILFLYSYRYNRPNQTQPPLPPLTLPCSSTFASLSNYNFNNSTTCPSSPTSVVPPHLLISHKWLLTHPHSICVSSINDFHGTSTSYLLLLRHMVVMVLAWVF